MLRKFREGYKLPWLWQSFTNFAGMVYRQVYKVIDNRVVVTLPAAFKDKQVVVTVDDIPASQSDKLALMKQAAHDSLFLAGLNEVNDDFKNIDHETL
jgi:hypothetical protein